jgi:hypothetical protein
MTDREAGMSMKAFWRAAVGVILLAGVAAAEQAPKKAPFKPTRPYVEGEIVVQFADKVDSYEVRQIMAQGGGTVVKVQERGHLALVALPSGTDTIKAVQRYRRIKGVVTAEPNYVITPIKHPAPKAKAPAKPQLKKK